MPRTVVYIFAGLLFMFFMMLTPLLIGIKIDKLNYKNFIFNGLYLKYDKSLIVSVDKLSVLYDGGNKKQDMSFELSIENFFDSFYIDVKRYTLQDPHLEFSGKVYLESYDSDNFSFAKFYINDFDFLWDLNLERLKASKAFIEYKDQSFYFNFEKPKYVDFDVEGSYASITDIIEDPMLNMHFYSKDVLKSSIMDLIKYYGVDLPLVQESGENNAYTKVIVPLTLSKLQQQGEEIYCDVDIKKGKLLVYDIPVHVDKVNVVYKDNFAYVKGKIKKRSFENEKYKLSYDGNIDLSLDFDNETGEGNYLFNDFKYRKIDLESTYGDFNADFKKELVIEFKLKDKTKFRLKDNSFIINSAHSTFKDDKVYTKLNCKGIEEPLSLDINDTFDLLKTSSSGKSKVDFRGDDISFSAGMLDYEIDYADDLDMNFSLKDETLLFKDEKFFLETINSRFFQNKLSLNGDLKYNFKNSYISAENLDVKIDMDTKKTNFTVEALMLETFNKILDVSNIKGTFDKGEVSLYGKLFNGDLGLEGSFQSLISLKDKNINGNMFLEKYKNKEYPQTFEYFIDYKNNLKVDIPFLSFKYEKKEKEHDLRIDNLEKFFPFGEFLKPKEGKAGLKATSKNLETFFISLENTCIDTQTFETGEKEQGKRDDLNIEIFSKNGCLRYKDLNLEHEFLDIKSVNSKVSAKLKYGKTHINLEKGEKFKLWSNYTESAYLNSLLEKEFLEKGYLTFNVQGVENIYNGKVELFDTKVKNIGILNSLIFFVNTTPAFINPLLSIPSLLRFTQSGFDLNSYDLDKGTAQFNYDKEHNKLFFRNIFLDGKMNDFQGDLEINLDTKALQGDIDVIFMKDYAKVINLIPGIGTISKGGDIKFSKSVKIEGTLEDPKFNPLD